MEEALCNESGEILKPPRDVHEVLSLGTFKIRLDLVLGILM